MITIPVALGDDAHDILVGHGARHRLLDVLPTGVERVAVVTQEAVGVPVDPGVEHQIFLLDDGEDAKCLESVERLCREFSRWGLTRADCVVAVGGGVVTDTAGFAAAVYHRGLPVVHVPTTLLGQIDAAIGGKTGVNLPEGKNLVGAFWQPAAVLCDTEVLETLPPREYASGLGEMAKYHFLAAPGSGDLADLALEERVARCVQTKVDIVTRDPTEGGDRALLNYGHTLAHALETIGDYDLRHGEAVAIGLVFAAELAARGERIDADRVAEHRRVVEGYGLPTTVDAGHHTDELIELMRRDKKALSHGSGSGLTFALDGQRGVEIVDDVAESDVRHAIAAVRR